MKERKRRLGIKAIALIVLLVIALFLMLINFITDILWFDEVGYLSVFLTQLLTELKIGIPLFVVLTIISMIYLMILKKGYYKRVESNDIVNEKRLKGLAWLLSAIASALVAFTVSTNLWFEILQYTNSTDFNLTDPLFDLDISFYIFKLAFVQQLNEMILGIVIVYAAVTVVYYMMLLSMRKPQMFEEVPPAEPETDDDRYDGSFAGGGNGGGFSGFGNGAGGIGGLFKKAMGGQRGNINRTRRPKKQFDDDNFMQLITIASKQLIALGVIFFLMIGVNFFLKQYDLLYSSTGVLYGAGFTDVNVTLWMYRALIVLSVVAAIVFAIGIAKKKFKMIFTVPVIMIAVGLVGTGAAYAVQNWIVSPDEINKESTYLERNIAYTKSAYGLDNVTVKNFAANNDLTLEDIENNGETISNIRINDYQPVQTFYNQTQAIRQYYSFSDVDVDRYMINGEYTQTFLSTREIDESNIRSEWLNQHLKYTHGYGITLSRVDKITSSGQPDVLIADIPPVSQVEEISIDRPEIYFGEMTNNYILVNTDEEEFDYPDGDGNAYTKYEGTAGIKLNPLNRIIFSIRERSIKLLVSTNIDSNSKIVINRNVMQRVQKIMPQLSYDTDPYMVIADGKLYWMLDAYTVSSNYPYSEPYSTDTSINYIRNSIKVVIDAYNGDVDFYIVDAEDPIAQTYKKIYPALLKDFDEMPESLQSHIRYPNTLFNIQAQVYQRYHMSDVKVFYQGEDVWEIANEIYGMTEQKMTPNYYVFKLPGEESAEFVNSIPYTPKNKKNMTGLLVARNDGENYGEIILYQLPKSRVVYGPIQVEAMIDQNTEISKEFSLWNSSGSTYTRGNMFVIPIEDSILYVEPVYLEATSSSIPEVKRVIVVYGDKIAYKETLSEALAALFGESTSPAETSEDPVASGDTSELSTSELIQLANEAFTNAQNAQQSGDWASYGEYLDQLQNYLELLANK